MALGGCFLLTPWLVLPLPLPLSLASLLAAVLAVPAEDVVLDPARPDGLAGDVPVESACVRGFIWMIFLDLVGGGGKAKGQLALSLLLPRGADARRRVLTVSAACDGPEDRGDEELSKGMWEDALKELCSAVGGIVGVDS